MRKAKKYLAILLAVLMLSGTFSVFAASDAKTTYTSGKYQAVKVSHPEYGVKQPDGLIDFENGDADTGQNYAWSAVGYGDWMYIGTCYAAMWQTLKIMGPQLGLKSEDEVRALMNVIFNGTLYVGDPKNNPEGTNRSIIVKINTKTSETKIVEPPATHGGYRGATVFNDKLYFIGTGKKPFLLEIDPKTDVTNKVYEADPVTKPGIATGIRGITEINGKLAASMIGDNGAYIVCSENPSAGKSSFKVIATQEDLFDYPANMYVDDIFGGSIWDMVSLNGKLYISIVVGRNGAKKGFALIGGEEQADGSWKYHVIAGDPKDGAKYPYGLGADRSGAGNLVVHNNQLYVGGYNDPMKALPAALAMNFEPMYKDFTSPVCLWRMVDAETEKFEMVAGDANEVFPEGPVGNMGAGFGNPLNQYVWRMASYNGKLFVGTFDIGSLAYPVMQFVNGDFFRRSPEEWKAQIDYIKTFIEMVSGSKSSLAKSVSVNALASDVKTIEALAEKGGINDIASTEKFYKAIKNIYNIYVKVKPILPEDITTQLDKILDEAKIDNFYYFLETCRYLSKGVRGFDLFVTEDGKNFDVITRDGFGDPYNHGLRTFAVTDNGLCIGTANPFFGAQVWRLDELNADKPTEDDKTEPEVTDPVTDPDKSDDITTDDKTEATDKADDKADAPVADTTIPDTGDTGIAVGMAVLAVIACGVAVKVSKKKED